MEPTACMNRSMHRINTSKNMARYKQVIRPHRSLQLVTVYKKVYFGVKTIAPPPFKASRGLFIKWRWRHNYIARCILTYGTYQKERVSLRAQGTKWQVIFHCAYACPKINHVHVMLWNKVTGSLASLSMIRLAYKILCQLGCDLLSLCGSVVKLLLFTACERRWQGLSIFLSCSLIVSDDKYKIRREIIQQL